MILWMDIRGLTDDIIKLFLEYGYVANQIEGNGTYSKIIANVLPIDTPHP